jgi:hypothetical protein
MPPRRSPAAPSQPSLPGPTIGGTRTQPSRRAQTRAPAVDHAEGEFFDLAGVSDGDDDDYIPANDPDLTNNPANDSNNPTNLDIPTTLQALDARINDPSLAPPKVSTAADIHYFFEKDADKIVCKECEWVLLHVHVSVRFWLGPTLRSKTKPSIKYEYSLKTSNTSLRPHIERHHRELYMTLAKENRWQIMLPGLLLDAHSQAAGAAAVAAMSEDDRPDTFNEHTFCERLVKFIVINDQVLSRHFFNI